ncbi:13001_t:CDS:1, partial [Racocetra fulgida]
LILNYDFNEREEITFLDNNLECLRYWPSDIEIDDAINTGYKRAVHLARHLEMTSIPNDAYYFNIHKKYPTSQLEDFWNDDSNLETADNNDHNEDNMNSLSISHCINNAVSEMNRSQELNSDPSPELLLEKTYRACQVVIEHVQKLPDISWFPSGK